MFFPQEDWGEAWLQGVRSQTLPRLPGVSWHCLRVLLPAVLLPSANTCPALQLILHPAGLVPHSAQLSTLSAAIKETTTGPASTNYFRCSE